jgi:hypothetical protein
MIVEIKFKLTTTIKQYFVWNTLLNVKQHVN